MQLNYKSFGQGEPLIILHGLLGSLDNWQTLGKQLAENFTVFLIDQRNHGKSPHCKTFNYEVLAEDLLHFMEEHHIHSSHILGHSMGGKTAMYFAIENPDKVNQLIVADIAPVEYPVGHQQIFDALLSIDLNLYNNRKDIEAKLQEKVPEFGVRQFLMKGLTRNEDRALTWKFNLQDIWAGYKNILQTFDSDEVFEQETLFIKGEKSNYILPQYEKDIATHFPHFTIETIQGAGHWLHAEKPKEFLAIVNQFLLQ